MWDQEPKSLGELNAIIARGRPSRAGRHASRSSAKAGRMRAIAFVGEQPGDQEDLQGRPFVGPAGQLLVARHARGRDRRATRSTSPMR